MQKITLLCVGKLKEKFYREAVSEYAKRLSRYCKLEVVELPEERLPEHPSQAQITAALGAGGRGDLCKAPPAASLIVLCIEGRLRSQ